MRLSNTKRDDWLAAIQQIGNSMLLHHAPVYALDYPQDRAPYASLGTNMNTLGAKLKWDKSIFVRFLACWCRSLGSCSC